MRKANKRGTEDTKGTVKFINLKQTDNAMAKNEKDKQTTAHMTQHRKPKNKQHGPHQKTRGDLRCFVNKVHLGTTSKVQCRM